MARNYKKKPKSKVFRKYKLSKPVPDTMMTTLVYESNYATTLGNIVNISHYTYRLSSIYDPDFTSVGHKPLGATEWNTFYQKYIVKGAKVYITARDTNNNSNSSIALIATLSEENAPNTQTQAVREQPNSKVMVLGCKQTMPQTMIVKYSPRQLFGYKDIADADDLIADVDTNPTKNAFLHISLEELDPNAGTRNGKVAVRVRIEYLVQFRGNKELLRS